MNCISLLLIEDQKLLLDTITDAFKHDDNFDVKGYLNDIDLAIDFLRKNKDIDIILSDICTANNHNALDYIANIKKEFPKIKIVLVTAFPELSFIEKAKNLKVDSFVYKNIPIEDLLAITKNTYIGYSSYPTTENENLAIFKELTEKELSILRLYCSGMNRKEIADKLCLSESTIKNYITEILLKTEYDSMAKLALYAVKNGFIL
jgi:DNA-binding NarL/FixJ family response regulator